MWRKRAGVGQDKKVPAPENEIYRHRLVHEGEGKGNNREIGKMGKTKTTR